MTLAAAVRSLPATAVFLVLAAPTVAQVARLVRDVHPTASSMPPGGSMAGYGPRLGEALLLLDDGVHGTELWRTDGTAAGTTMVVDLTPGPTGTSFGSTASSRSAFWFTSATSTGADLWRSDGTAAGTTLLVPGGTAVVTTPQAWAPLGDVLFFERGGTLGRTDGTPAGTFLLPAPAGFVAAIRGPFALLNCNNDLVVTDGSFAVVAATNAWVTDLGPGLLTLHQRSAAPVQTTITWLEGAGAPSTTLPGNVYAFRLASRFLLWQAPVSASNSALWAWNGTSSPVPLVTLGPADGPVLGRDRLYFAHTDPATGREPWASDGTPAGTHAIDLTPGPASSTFDLVGVIDDQLMLWLTTPATGSEPFVSDGTVAGTVLLGDLEPGPAGSQWDEPFAFSGALVQIGERLIAMPVTTSAAGRELWLTDGTPAGTLPLPEIRPGPVSSLPNDWWFPAFAGNSAIFFADDGTTGSEPYAIDFEGIARWLGNGLGDGGTRPFTLGDPVLGAPWTIGTTGLAPPDHGVVGVSLPPVAAVPLGAGVVLCLDLGSALPLAAIAPDPSGAWSLTLVLPSLPALVGLDLVLQPLFAPSAHPAGYDAGPAAWLTLGF